MIQRIDRIQCLDDALLHLFSLHDSGKEPGLKAEMILVVLQLVDKVTIACRILTGDHGDMLTEHWQRE